MNRKHRYDLKGIDSVLSQMERELRDLEERGVIQIDITQQGTVVYSFASSIMEWWVIKEIENSRDKAELAERQKVFRNLNRRQLARLKDVMEQVWQHKDALASIAGWIGKLAGAFTRGLAGGGTS